MAEEVTVRFKYEGGAEAAARRVQEVMTWEAPWG